MFFTDAFVIIAFGVGVIFMTSEVIAAPSTRSKLELYRKLYENSPISA